MSRLKVGDKVMWRGGWGEDAPREAVVKSMELCADGCKYGRQIKSVAWETISKGNRSVTLDLDTGHWAYGYQISQIK